MTGRYEDVQCACGCGRRFVRYVRADGKALNGGPARRYYDRMCSQKGKLVASPSRERQMKAIGDIVTKAEAYWESHPKLTFAQALKKVAS